MGHVTDVEIDELIGKTFVEVTRHGTREHDDEVVFTTADGECYRMYHRQDCSEHVWLEDVVGDLDDLVGHEIVRAEEATSADVHPNGVEAPEWREESFTWTFYTLATVRGYVTLRWFGTSNGWYSESVDIVHEAPA